MIRLRPATADAAGIFTLDLPAAPADVKPVFAQSGGEAMVLHTSGTTARPKMVPLTQANLAASVENIIATLALAPKRPADLVMAMVLATRRYVPPSYPGRVILFKQTDDQEGELRFGDYGWGNVVRGGLEICEIPGDHLTLLVEPGVATVAARLDAAMKSTSASADESK